MGALGRPPGGPKDVDPESAALGYRDGIVHTKEGDEQPEFGLLLPFSSPSKSVRPLQVR
jgi:hypothetical protein